jgi:hypothetical protein
MIMAKSKQNEERDDTPRIHGEEAFTDQDRSQGGLDYRDGSVTASDPAAYDYDFENDEEADMAQNEVDTEEENDRG